MVTPTSADWVGHANAHARAWRLPRQRRPRRRGGRARRPRLQRHRQGDLRPDLGRRPGRGPREHLPRPRAARAAAARPARGRRRGRGALRARGPRRRHHHHLVCDRCGEVAAFEDVELERAIARLAERVGLLRGRARRDAPGRLPRLPAAQLRPRGALLRRHRAGLRPRHPGPGQGAPLPGAGGLHPLLRLHPHQRPHDQGAGELVARQRGDQGRHPRAPHGLGDPAAALDGLPRDHHREREPLGGARGGRASASAWA